MEQAITGALSPSANAYVQARMDTTAVDDAVASTPIAGASAAHRTCTGFDPTPTPPMPPMLPPWGPRSDMRDLVDVLRDVILRLEQLRTPVRPAVQVPTWALAQYGDPFLNAVGPIVVRANNAVPFGMVEGTFGSFEAARRLLLDRSSGHNTYTLGIIEVTVGNDVAFQVVRLNTERLEQHQRDAGWRGLQVTRRHGGQTATLRLVDTDQGLLVSHRVMRDHLPVAGEQPAGGGARRNG